MFQLEVQLIDEPGFPVLSDADNCIAWFKYFFTGERSAPLKQPSLCANMIN